MKQILIHRRRRMQHAQQRQVNTNISVSLAALHKKASSHHRCSLCCPFGALNTCIPQLVMLLSSATTRAMRVHKESSELIEKMFISFLHSVGAKDALKLQINKNVQERTAKKKEKRGKFSSSQDAVLCARRRCTTGRKICEKFKVDIDFSLATRLFFVGDINSLWVLAYNLASSLLWPDTRAD